MEKDTIQSTIYVGLCDMDTGIQKYDTEKYMSILKNICRSYKVAFSVQLINGGYFHQDGRYTEENTLVLSLVEVFDAVVMEIAKDLCAFFHQESVMVTASHCTTYYVHEQLD